MDINIVAVTSEATGIPERLVISVLKEGKESLEKGKCLLPRQKGKKCPKKPTIDIGTFTDSSIVQKISEFYVVKKEWSSLRKLLVSRMIL